jgi:hypothetical protein
MDPQDHHVSCANIAPHAACCQGLHDRSHTRTAVWQKGRRVLQTFPQPRWGELDSNAVENGEVAREDQSAHQDEEQSSPDMDEFDVAFKLAEEMKKGVDGDGTQQKWNTKSDRIGAKQQEAGGDVGG